MSDEKCPRCGLASKIYDFDCGACRTRWERSREGLGFEVGELRDQIVGLKTTIEQRDDRIRSLERRLDRSL